MDDVLRALARAATCPASNGRRWTCYADVASWPAHVRSQPRHKPDCAPGSVSLDVAPRADCRRVGHRHRDGALPVGVRAKPDRLILLWCAARRGCGVLPWEVHRGRAHCISIRMDQRSRLGDGMVGGARQMCLSWVASFSACLDLLTVWGLGFGRASSQAVAPAPGGRSFKPRPCWVRLGACSFTSAPRSGMERPCALVAVEAVLRISASSPARSLIATELPLYSDPRFSPLSRGDLRCP